LYGFVSLLSAFAVEEAGGKALACIVDIRDEKQVIDSVQQAVAKFGGIDICKLRDG
jgi:NADP-dependent 3-hydroxy acid dehydrogenase YdfG